MLQVVVAFTGTCIELPAPEAEPGGAAAATAAAATAEPSAASGASSSSSSSSRPGHSSSNKQVSWSYLLQLQSIPQWTAALAAFDAKWPGWRADVTPGYSAVDQDSSDTAMQQTAQQFTDAVELCSALAAAAPLQLVCNNPGCESLAQVSEAAASSKRCTRCRCHYCGVDCQTADWKRHKHACKGMAAAGLTCV
uniref:MYND-type domain-containing protein n=1 Tax=Tetradesmus obliquus TaxID=3088 RepID=A0A383VXT2_TETOB|eukprot:jgi/Sobl393_1/16942/SZX69653.1